MTLDLYSGAIIVGIVQTVFLALSLLLKKSQLRQANVYLASLLCCFGMALVVHFLTITQLWQQYLLVYMMLSTVLFALGPNLYFYVRQMTNPGFRFRLVHLNHYLPLLLNIGYFLVLYYQQSAEVGTQQPQNMSFLTLLLPISKMLSLIVYTLLSLRLLLQHTQHIKQLFSDPNNKSLHWLRNLVFGFLLLESLFILLFVFQIDTSQIPGEVDTLLSAVIIVMVFMTGFYGLQQPQIFSQGLPLVTTQQAAHDVANRSSGPLLSQGKVTKIQSALDILVQDFSVFQDHFLDLKMLADKVNITPHQLSYFLNNELGVNFYEYVNLQRVAYAKKQLIETEDKILDIALQAGFSNKATFNSAFKRSTQMTPSQFRVQQTQK